MGAKSFEPEAGRGQGASEPAALGELVPSSLAAGATAIFLDFDGTLAEIEERPDAVRVTTRVQATLARLQQATDAATAIVTGRPIAEIDRFLAPLKLPIAGVHGLERRSSDGTVFAAPIDENVLHRLHERLARIADRETGLLLEVKTGSMALHYRRRPELEQACLAAVDNAVSDLSGVEILRGKMVVEIKAGRGTKGDAIAAFMGEAPFRGRVPLFAGDDVTDEDAFREIARLGGISIKIGAGDTYAAYRAENTQEFHQWLSGIANAFDTGRHAG